MRIVVAIVHKEGQFLIVRRRKREGSLHWQFPAGEINDQEDAPHAACRETLEETGIECKAITCFGERIHPDSGMAVSYWLCEYVSGSASLVDPEELDAVAWLDGREAINRITSNLYPPVHEYLLICTGKSS